MSTLNPNINPVAKVLQKHKEDLLEAIKHLDHEYNRIYSEKGDKAEGALSLIYKKKMALADDYTRTVVALHAVCELRLD